MKSGIYCIEVKAGNNFKFGFKYIGKAINCGSRIQVVSGERNSWKGWTICRV